MQWPNLSNAFITLSYLIYIRNEKFSATCALINLPKWVTNINADKKSLTQSFRKLLARICLKVSYSEIDGIWA